MLAECRHIHPIPPIHFCASGDESRPAQSVSISTSIFISPDREVSDPLSMGLPQPTSIEGLFPLFCAWQSVRIDEEDALAGLKYLRNDC